MLTDIRFPFSSDPANQRKNRYKNILPFDHSRVKLVEVNEGQDGADYINANFLDGFKQKGAYIATQVGFGLPGREGGRELDTLQSSLRSPTSLMRI